MKVHDEVVIYYLISSLRRCGAVTVLYNTISNLGPGLRPVILTMSSEGNDSLQSAFVDKLKCSVVRLDGTRGMSVISTAIQVAKLLRSTNGSLLHSHGLRPDLVSAIVSLLGYKSISTIHSNFYLDYRYKYGPIIGGVLSFVHACALRRITIPVAVSNSLKNVFASKGIEKVQAVRNGIDLRLYSTQSSRRNPKNIISYGRIINLKRFDLVVRAFVEADLQDVELHVCGDGPAMVDLMKYSNNRVKFLGNVRNIHERLGDYRCFISASETEAMPNAVIESLCAGLVVILSDIAPHREIADLIGSEENGIHYFETGNLAELRNQIVKAYQQDRVFFAARNMEAFSAKTMTLGYERIYKSLISFKAAGV